MRIGRLAGALIGAMPGLVLWAIGLIVTGGGDGMIPFGMGGVTLTLIGLIGGFAWGSRPDSWPVRNSGIGAVTGSAGVLVLVGGLIALGGGQRDPALDARDCREFYELHGATGPLGELQDLPAISEDQIEGAYLIVEQDPTDEACVELERDLDAQTGS